MQPLSTALTGTIEAIKSRVENQTGTAISAITSDESRLFGELIATGDLSSPDDVDEALVALLTSQLGLSVKLTITRDFSGKHPYRRELRDLALISPDEEATQTAIRVMTAAFQPATEQSAIGWLATLRTLVKARAASEFEAEITIRAYSEKLRDYPADIVQHVLATWPDHSEWWPSWHELKICLDECGVPRKALKQRLYRLLHDNAASCGSFPAN